MRSFLLAVATLVALPSTLGHGLMSFPVPRAGTTQAGNNKGGAAVGPCGNGGQLVQNGNNPTTLQAGQLLTVPYATANGGGLPHDGLCTVTVTESTAAEPGTNGDGKVNEGVIASTTLANCADAQSIAVTIPEDAACENCLVQWYWEGDQNYYDCADINIANANGAVGGAAIAFFGDGEGGMSVEGILALVGVGVFLIGFLYLYCKYEGLRVCCRMTFSCLCPCCCGKAEKKGRKGRKKKKARKKKKQRNPMGDADTVVAKYKYKPQHSDELELSKGNEYIIRKDLGDGWLKVEDPETGDVGLIPANYVN